MESVTVNVWGSDKVFNFTTKKARSDFLEAFEYPAVQAVRQLSPSGDRFLYFLEAEKVIKVGIASCVSRRRNQFALHHPREVKLLGLVENGSDLEKVILALYKTNGLRGEWLGKSLSLLTAIRLLVAHPQGALLCPCGCNGAKRYLPYVEPTRESQRLAADRLDEMIEEALGHLSADEFK